MLQSHEQIGIYVHIPHCLQVCPYCDFTKFHQDRILPLSDYTQLLINEISATPHFPFKINSIALGGGTPSLLCEADFTLLMASIKANFELTPDCEISLEANPGTLNQSKLKAIQDLGFNRISIGAQTFSETHLKALKREHSVEQTLQTVELVKKYNFPFSLDILYALPNQSLTDLHRDLKTVIELTPQHISAYILTLEASHFMQTARPNDDIQAEMYDYVSQFLSQNNYEHYEISNFAKSKFRSLHNQIYWKQGSYLAYGVSSCGFLNNYHCEMLNIDAPYGFHYQNHKSLSKYSSYVQNLNNCDFMNWMLQLQNLEICQLHQSITDFTHTSLRHKDGFQICGKFPQSIENLLLERCYDLKKRGLLLDNSSDNSWTLTPLGKRISNQVFLYLTFLKDDLCCAMTRLTEAQPNS